MDINFPVYVRCMTFNHAPYIEDTMNGFCMQETSFPFVCTIMDDASTDGEPEVIKNYLQEHFDLDNKSIMRNEDTDDYEMTFAQHKRNKNCHFAVFFLKYNHYSIKKSKRPYIEEWKAQVKYIAICEGDDYWIDSLKLQKQFDFMEAHCNCVLCQHAAMMLYPDKTTKENRRFTETMDNCPPEGIINGGAGITCSTFYRKELNDVRPDWRKNAPVGDLPLILTALNQGEIGYIDEVMSCYRISSSGSWTERVARVFPANLRHAKSKIRMYKDYNKWSNYQFNKVIKKQIQKERIRIMKCFLFYLKTRLIS